MIASIPDFNLLLISKWIEFWFAKFAPKYLNSSTLSKELLSVFALWLLPAFWSRAMTMYLALTSEVNCDSHFNTDHVHSRNDNRLMLQWCPFFPSLVCIPVLITKRQDQHYGRHLPEEVPLHYQVNFYWWQRDVAPYPIALQFCHTYRKVSASSYYGSVA